MIQAKVIADSKNKFGNRITTMVVTMPRIILAEFNTHRMFSRNSASSRAIPFAKMVKSVEENPFIPIAWQKDHKGMQGIEYTTDDKELSIALDKWRIARQAAMHQAKILNEQGITKQLCNRLLEPFMWHTVIVTATEWENFFALRCPQYAGKSTNADIKYYRSKKDFLCDANKLESRELVPLTEDKVNWLSINKGQAEIHMMALAEAMWDAYNESIPKELKDDEWHIPFGDNIDEHVIFHQFKLGNADEWGLKSFRKELDEIKIKIATARCARVSYTVVGDDKKSSEEWQKMYPDFVVVEPDGWDRSDFDKSWNEPITLDEYNERLMNSVCLAMDYKSTYIPLKPKDNYENDIKLHDRLMASGHWSPFEHCAKAMTNIEYDQHINGNTNLKSLTNDGHGNLIININLDESQSNGWSGNFRGFIQYRKMFSNENIK